MITQTLAQRATVLALALLSWAVLSPSNSAFAASPFRLAEGNFVIVNPATDDIYTELGTIGTDIYYREDLTFQYTGDLVGTAQDVNYIVVHADGSFESIATETCTGCTLNGRTGNFTAVYVLAGTDFFFENGNFSYSGFLTVTSASGGLAGLRASGTFGSDGVETTYAYHYRFGR